MEDFQPRRSIQHRLQPVELNGWKSCQRGASSLAFVSTSATSESRAGTDTDPFMVSRQRAFNANSKLCPPIRNGRTFALHIINQWMSANRLKLIPIKQLLWAGTKNCLYLYDGSFPCLQLGAYTILPGQHVRVLGVVISSDLSREACFQGQRFFFPLSSSTPTYSALTQQ